MPVWEMTNNTEFVSFWIAAARLPPSRRAKASLRRDGGRALRYGAALAMALLVF